MADPASEAVGNAGAIAKSLEKPTGLLTPGGKLIVGPSLLVTV